MERRWPHRILSAFGRASDTPIARVEHGLELLAAEWKEGEAGRDTTSGFARHAAPARLVASLFLPRLRTFDRVPGLHLLHQSGAMATESPALEHVRLPCDDTVSPRQKAGSGRNPPGAPSESPPVRRLDAAVSRRWLPALLALAFPGAGHLYAGYPLRALGVAVVTAGLLLPGALYIWTLPVLPVSTAAPLRSVGALAVLALPALDAARLATRRSESSAERARFAAAGVALPFAVFALLALDFSLVTSRWLAPMRLDRESGRPNLLPGDLLLVDVRPDLLHTDRTR